MIRGHNIRFIMTLLVCFAFSVRSGSIWRCPCADKRGHRRDLFQLRSALSVSSCSLYTELRGCQFSNTLMSNTVKETPRASHSLRRPFGVLPTAMFSGKGGAYHNHINPVTRSRCPPLSGSSEKFVPGMTLCSAETSRRRKRTAAGPARRANDKLGFPFSHALASAAAADLLSMTWRSRR